MRTKLVNRYYCDHCNKGGCSKGAMVKHERRCCHNPERACGMCKEVIGMEAASTPIPDLIHELRTGGIPALREKANGCPACMLAAIIQNRKAMGPGGEDEDWYFRGEFDFKKERDALWAEKNTAIRHQEVRPWDTI